MWAKQKDLAYLPQAGLQNKIHIYLPICKVRLGDFPAILGNPSTPAGEFPVLLSIYFDIYKFSFEATFDSSNNYIQKHYQCEIVINSSEFLKKTKDSEWQSLYFH